MDIQRSNNNNIVDSTITTVMFTDPIFPLTLLTSNQLIGILDGVFQITFICAILFFWLCIYHGLRQVCGFLFFIQINKYNIITVKYLLSTEREETDCILSS